MPRQPVTRDTSMVELMGHALAEAEGANFNDNATRYRRLALAALKPLARPTEAMIDAAYEAVWFDAQWAIKPPRFRSSGESHDHGGDQRRRAAQSVIGGQHIYDNVLT